MSEHGPSFAQRLATMFVSRQRAAAMEAELRAWLARCNDCGHERSIWELGGIRYKAAGNPGRRLACPQCGHATWHKINKDGPAGAE